MGRHDSPMGVGYDRDSEVLCRLRSRTEGANRPTGVVGSGGLRLRADVWALAAALRTHNPVHAQRDLQIGGLG
jgi:hypothetical protein